MSFALDARDAFGQAVATLVGNPSKDVDGWLAIAADGTVTAFTGKCEMGQGLYTAQTQLVAEELGVPVERVKLIQCITGTTPDQGVTSGAQSHPQNFNHANLALAAATAREALLQMASKHLGVPVDQLTVGDGVVDSSGERTGDLRRADRRQEIQPRAQCSTPSARHPREWTVLGNPVKRLDMPEMVTGRLRVRAQRARAGHGARPRRPSANRRRNARQRRRKLRQQHARLHQGRRQEQLRRRRLREAVAGRSGGKPD